MDCLLIGMSGTLEDCYEEPGRALEVSAWGMAGWTGRLPTQGATGAWLVMDPADII